MDREPTSHSTKTGTDQSTAVMTSQRQSLIPTSLEHIQVHLQNQRLLEAVAKIDEGYDQSFQGPANSPKAGAQSSNTTEGNGTPPRDPEYLFK